MPSSFQLPWRLGRVQGFDIYVKYIISTCGPQKQVEQRAEAVKEINEAHWFLKILRGSGSDLGSVTHSQLRFQLPLKTCCASLANIFLVLRFWA